jgi:hypothetical protein
VKRISQRTLVGLVTWAATVVLQAQSLQKLPSGLEFLSPARWEVKVAGEAAVLSPPDAKLMPDRSPAELYVVTTLAGIKDLKDPRLGPLLEGKYLPGGKGKVLGSPKRFQASGGAGYVYRYEFQEQGVTGNLEIYSVEFAQGGVGAVIAVGTVELIANRSSLVAALAASLALAPGVTRTDEKSPLIRQWDQHLRGKKMVQMSSYNSGSSGGSNSRRTLALAADGSFTYHSSSSVSIYVDRANGNSSGQKSDAGQWRLYEQAGKVILETKSSNGEVSTGVLTMDGSTTLLNNVRWFVVDIN